MLRDSTPRYVGPLIGWLVGRLVGRLVGWSPFYFFSVFELYEPTAPAKLLWRLSPVLLLSTRTRLG